MSGKGVGVGEGGGIGVRSGDTGVMEAIKVGKVTGVSSGPSVDSEAHPNKVTQTTRKNAKRIQRFIGNSDPLQAWATAQPVFLQTPPLLL